MNLTRTIANVENIARGIVLSKKARLWLLNLAQTGGYTLGIEVKSGWLVGDAEQSEGSTGQIKVEVAEAGNITATIMRECAGFAFLQKGESLAQVRIFPIETRREPVGEIARLWQFGVTPTAETIEIP